MITTINYQQSFKPLTQLAQLMQLDPTILRNYLDAKKGECFCVPWLLELEMV